MNLERLDYEVDAFRAYMTVRDKYTMLLESGYRAKDTGDNSIILFNPKLIISYNNGITITRDSKVYTHVKDDVFKVLEKYIIDKKPLGTGLVFDGGFAGYISYDYGLEIMNVTRKNKNNYIIPEVVFCYYEDFIIIDHKNHITHICSEDKSLIQEIKGCRDKYPVKEVVSVELSSNFTRSEYETKVESVREYIRQGEVYQVNISQQFRSSCSVNPYDVYSRFRTSNYGPYNAFIELDGSFILSTSPEQLLRKRGRSITSRPIKGTIKKVLDKVENDRLKEELYNSEKDRSELLMIIDLVRNDLSKICIPGTVKVESLFDVEEYATVNHLVSTVNGELIENKKLSDIIGAFFPGGSITGAPKLRAMEVIEELENLSRSIYTGSIGYVSNNGNMDFNIAIRTAAVTNEGIFYNVGGGIVWDSVPEDEYEETLHKGRAIYKALTGRDE